MNSFTVGGTERLLLGIISYLNKKEYDVEIITLLDSGSFKADFKKLEIPIYSTSTSFTDFLYRKLPFRLYLLLIAPITFIRITFFLIKSKPDIIISSLCRSDVLGMTSAKITGIKKRILIQHEIIRFGKFKKFIEKMFALRISTNIISVSETVKDFLIEYFGVKSDKITTIYNGVDYEKFKKGIKLISDLGIPVIGVIGRLEEIKGQIYLLKALKVLKEKYQLSPETIVAGDGSLRKELEKYATKNNLKDIKFLGNVKNVPDALSKIDILIIPSIEEGFGLVVLEGMVSGKAIITSDIKVMHELIRDGETGLLFKSKDANSLADILFKVLSNKELYEKLQRNAFSFIEQNKKLFDIREVSKTYQDLFCK